MTNDWFRKFNSYTSDIVEVEVSASKTVPTVMQNTWPLSEHARKRLIKQRRKKVGDEIRRKNAKLLRRRGHIRVCISFTHRHPRNYLSPKWSYLIISNSVFFPVKIYSTVSHRVEVPSSGSLVFINRTFGRSTFRCGLAFGRTATRKISCILCMPKCTGFCGPLSQIQSIVP